MSNLSNPSRVVEIHRTISAVISLRIFSSTKAIEGKQLCDETYSAFLSALLDFQPDEQFTLSLSTAAERDLKPAGIKLRPYQRAGIHWLV